MPDILPYGRTPRTIERRLRRLGVLLAIAAVIYTYWIGWNWFSRQRNGGNAPWNYADRVGVDRALCDIREAVIEYVKARGTLPPDTASVQPYLHCKYSVND